MLTGRDLAQLAHVFARDADAIEDAYRWPPRAPLTRAERIQVAFLVRQADAIFEKAKAAGQLASGTDYCFGEEKIDE